MIHVRLTPKQRQLYDFIACYVKEHGYSPSFGEIAAGLGLKSQATVSEHIQNLARAGAIRYEYNKARSITLFPLEEDVLAAQVANPSPENGWEVPAVAKYVPVDSLQGLFREWLRKRLSDELAPA